MNTSSLWTTTTELFLEKDQTHHHEPCFNFAGHRWNATDVLELKIFVFQYLHTSAFLNAHLSLFIHTTEQFFKICLSALLTWNCCSWTQHLDPLHGLGCGNRGCSRYRRCHVTMAVFLQMALPCLGSDLEYGNRNVND